ncbi:MAG: ribosome small subunit-dependent GTPase A [Proteobacteria bacterium]|nr:ribosome small subunit-dependent GTPase A [Pseudomonadota bacterium]
MQLPDAARHDLIALGWPDDARARAALESMPDGRIARVSAQHRSGYIVATGIGREFSAQALAAWTRRDCAPEQRAVVGDWVLLEPARDQIVALLPRRSLLQRAAAGESYRRQSIAANVDTVFVVSGLDADFNPRRLERYLLLVRASGAEPVLVLTKLDTHPDLDVAEPLAVIAEQGVAIVRVNAKDAASVAALHPWLGVGRSVALVGSSGAGKSTLTNTLLGRQKMKTAAVRAHDARGRHTTTHRALIGLPQGGVLIDSPGMRELKPTGVESIEEGGFEDIETLAASCRFRDCAHGSEPGCAVRAALDAGTLDAARYANYRKLGEEIADAAQGFAAQLLRKAEGSARARAYQQRHLHKYGRK